MDGFKTNYSVSEMILLLRHLDEPWMVEWDAMTLAEKDKALRERYKKIKEALGDKALNIKIHTSTVGEIE